MRYAVLDYFREKDWLKGRREYIKTNKKWSYKDESEYYNFDADKYICFYGPSDIEIHFDENKIYFTNPPYRYNYWFYWLEKIHRDEWRKYMYQVITAFGGNRVIYLPDNMLDSSKYFQNNDNMTFQEIENGLINEYGVFNKKLDKIAEYEEIHYYIDYFDDINWKINAPIDEYLPEL
jgi:hypothetical protein